MSGFTADVERDAQLVYAAMVGGFSAVCSQAMLLPDFAGGPDRVIEHGNWLRSQPKSYIKQVTDRVVVIERGESK